MASQLVEKFAVISVNTDLNSAFLRPIHNAGCSDRMTSMQAIQRPLTLPMRKFYTPEELEDELLRVGKRQVEEGAQLIVIACTLVSLLLPPGGLARLTEKLGIAVIDPHPIAVKTAEMMVALGLGRNNYT